MNGLQITPAPQRPSFPRLAVAWLALGLYSCSATGASPGPEGAASSSLAWDLSRSECAVQAYAADPTPGRFDLLAQPEAEAEVIAQLPSDAAIELTVTLRAAQERWVQVEQAVRENQQLEFSGQGWALATALRLRTKGYETQGVPLYDSANAESQVLARLPADYPVTLVSCDRDWVKVKTETQQGWLAPVDQCANPYSLCPASPTP